jgi:hypothetical protein
MRVRTLANRLVDQNVGEKSSQLVASDLHSWSQGVSGQAAASWVEQLALQRSAVSKITCATGSYERSVALRSNVP